MNNLILGYSSVVRIFSRRSEKQFKKQERPDVQYARCVVSSRKGRSVTAEDAAIEECTERLVSYMYTLRARDGLDRVIRFRSITPGRLSVFITRSSCFCAGA